MPEGGRTMHGIRNSRGSPGRPRFRLSPHRPGSLACLSRNGLGSPADGAHCNGAASLGQARHATAPGPQG
jgi:hypothetical protein